MVAMFTERFPISFKKVLSSKFLKREYLHLKLMIRLIYLITLVAGEMLWMPSSAKSCYHLISNMKT